MNQEDEHTLAPLFLGHINQITSFSWTCFKNKIQACEGNLDNNKSSLTIPSKLLAQGSTYGFTMRFTFLTNEGSYQD